MRGPFDPIKPIKTPSEAFTPDFVWKSVEKKESRIGLKLNSKRLAKCLHNSAHRQCKFREPNRGIRLCVETQHTHLQIEKHAPGLEGTCLTNAECGPGSLYHCPFWFGALKLTNENLQRRKLPFDQLVRGRFEIMINLLHIHCESRFQLQGSCLCLCKWGCFTVPRLKGQMDEVGCGFMDPGRKGQTSGNAPAPSSPRPPSAPRRSLHLFSML